MFTSGFTNTPITKFLLVYILASAVLLSILDVKHLAGIHVSPHLWSYGQFWRCALWHLAGFANSTEALFAGILVYQVRVVERAWGGRKVVSFLLSTLPYTTLLPPILLALLIRPISLNTINYLPSGPTAAVFALLAQYHALIPHTFRYRLATSTSPTSPTTTANTSSSSSSSSSSSPSTTAAEAQTTPKTPLTITLSSKSPVYLIASQLALSQFPYMLLPAATGWMVGLVWRAEMLPGGVSWRVPAWVVGEKERTNGSTRRRREGGGMGSAGADDPNERYEDLRRRLEGEVVAAGRSSGLERQGQGQGQGQTQGQGQGVDGQRQRRAM